MEMPEKELTRKGTETEATMELRGRMGERGRGRVGPVTGIPQLRQCGNAQLFQGANAITDSGRMA